MNSRAYASHNQLEAEKILSSFDPYSILNIAQKATKEQINAAYKMLMLKYHPDKQSHLTKEVATRVAKKLNYARDHAMEYVSVIDEMFSDSGSPENMVDIDAISGIYTSHFFKIVSYSHGTGAEPLLKTSFDFAIRIMLIWGNAILEKRQEEFMKYIWKLLSVECTFGDIFNFLNLTEPYESNCNLIDMVKNHRCGKPTSVDHSNPSCNFMISENISHKLTIWESVELAGKMAIAKPLTPIIMYFQYPDNNKSLLAGLYYENEKYFVFNPSYITHPSASREAQGHSWEEASLKLAKALHNTSSIIKAGQKHFISFFNMLQLPALTIKPHNQRLFHSSTQAKRGNNEHHHRRRRHRRHGHNANPSHS